MSVHGAWLEQRGTEVILPAQSDAMQDSCCLDPLYDALPYATVLVAWDGTIDAINAAARDLAHIPTMAGLQAGKNVYDVLAMLQNPEAGILAEALRCILRGESQNFTRQALISEKPQQQIAFPLITILHFNSILQPSQHQRNASLWMANAS
jgi:hypothetical protein